MTYTGKTHRSRRMTGVRTVLGAVAVLSLLTVPIGAGAQNKPAAKVKKTTYDRWEMYCPENSCGIMTRAVRGMIVIGFSNQSGAPLLQVRLPSQAPEGRPVVMRLHKSGTLVHLRVTKCFKGYCIANSPPEKLPEVAKAFSQEASGTLGYQLGQLMQLEVFSLSGFNKAYAELLKRKPKPRKK